MSVLRRATCALSLSQLGPVSSFRVGCLVIACLSGCSEHPNEPRHPVQGQVFFAGQPLAEAMVVFHPQDATESKLPKPVAYTDNEGKFKLTTLTTADGAVAGKYVITIEQRAMRIVGDEPVRDGPNLLPPRYARVAESPLSYTVTAGENMVPVIQLKK
jgi:hypothetical protein